MELHSPIENAREHFELQNKVTSIELVPVLVLVLSTLCGPGSGKYGLEI